MDKELRKEIVKKLNRVQKIDAEARELKYELGDMIYDYFNKSDSFFGLNLHDLMIDFTENGEYGVNHKLKDGSYVDIICSGNEFMKQLEKFYKKNKIT